jgi:hypothetical protein
MVGAAERDEAVQSTWRRSVRRAGVLAPALRPGQVVVLDNLGERTRRVSGCAS